MRLIPASARLNYPFDPALNFGFERFEGTYDFTLAVSVTDPEYLTTVRGPIVYFDLEEPNKWFTTLKPATFPHYGFDYTLTIDPYSARFFSDYDSRPGESCFIPTDPHRVPSNSGEREFDVVFAGHLVSKELVRIIEVLSANFRVAVVSGSNHPLVTHRSLNYSEKLEIFSRSKTALVHGVLWAGRDEKEQLRRNLPHWRSHEAFSQMRNPLRTRFSVPQLKSRLFEAAICGSVPIVVNDSWNLWRNYFSPEQVIPADETSLVEVLRGELTDTKMLKEKSDSLREKAFSSYTTDAFVHRYLDALEI